MLPERLTADKYQKINLTSSWFLKVLQATVNEHQERYDFAAQRLQGATNILDIASGSGWGSAYLADQTGASVLGVGNDQEAILEAETQFPRERVSYLKGNILHLCEAVDVNKFEGVVSFETLEHFPESLGVVILQNLRAVLSDEGKLYISSPNGPLFSPYFVREGKSWYKYHFKEYTPEEMYDLLKKNGFNVEGFYGQRFVDPKLYLALAKIMEPIRRSAIEKNLPWDHRQMRLPLTLLFRLAALQSDAKVKPLECDSFRKPLLLTAVCTSS